MSITRGDFTGTIEVTFGNDRTGSGAIDQATPAGITQMIPFDVVDDGLSQCNMRQTLTDPNDNDTDGDGALSEEEVRVFMDAHHGGFGCEGGLGHEHGGHAGHKSKGHDGCAGHEGKGHGGSARHKDKGHGECAHNEGEGHGGHAGLKHKEHGGRAKDK